MSNSTAEITWARWHMPAMESQAMGMEPSVETVTMTETTRAELHDQSRREGWALGLSEGRAAAKQELAAQAYRWQGLVDALAQPVAAMDALVQTQLVDLAMALASQLAQHDIALHPERVLLLVRAAIALLPSSCERIRVQLHPDDLRFVQAQLLGDEAHWQLIDNPTMQRGGVLISTENSSIDERFETRVARLFERLICPAENNDGLAETAPCNP